MQKYQNELSGLIEIFDRKEKELLKLDKLEKEDRGDERIDINEQYLLFENLNLQLAEEINIFKLTRENDLMLILKKFLKEKSEINNEISEIFVKKENI